MTLYLTSDESVTDGGNSRTNFKNRILADYFESQPFNLKLQEIFFDSKFPTLANFEFPHIITTIVGKEHKLREFPKKFQNNSLFKFLCKDYKTKEYSPLLIEQQVEIDSSLSEIDFDVYYEIHPRLNIAFSIAFIKDVTILSQKDVIDLLNSNMFPFHNKKPLKYMKHGHVQIDTNLNIFFSKSVLQLLGFISFESDICEEQVILPFRNAYTSPSFIENPDTTVIYKDMLSRLEAESPLYSNYRTLIAQKPKGRIQVEFFVGGHSSQFEIEYDMDLFNQRKKAIVYDDEIELINKLLLKKYLSVIKENILNLNQIRGGSISEEDQQDLDDFINFLLKDRTNMKGLEKWGGLFTLSRTKNNHILVEVFHTEKKKEFYKQFHSTIEVLPDAPLLKQASLDIFFSSKLKNVSFNPILCHLLGVSETVSSSITLQMDGEEERMLPLPLNYYKATRYEIRKSSLTNASFALQLIYIEEEFPSNSFSIKSIKTNADSIFMIDRKEGMILGDQSINLKINSPEMIFVCGNFVQHSLVGSNQKQILNFFPLPQTSNNVVHHKFKNPIILKTLPGSVFHINLLDQNFKQIKADVGTPTLVVLKKSPEEDMFPVTLISSDDNNLQLFPDNKANSFKNKLSFPLLFNKSQEWGVCLRSLVYPKVKNIFSKYCFFTVRKLGDKQGVTITLNDSYVTSETKLIFLLNEKIREMLPVDSERPSFSLYNGFAKLETKGYQCHINGDFSKILGLSLSYQREGLTYEAQQSIIGVLEINLLLLQPQEMLLISNIVEEAFYAQSRPKILKIVAIIQSVNNAYNYIQFDDEDFIPLKVDRIDDIQISIMDRKGDFIQFIDHQDVKCQLEFKQFS